jgi:putative transposase
VPHWKEIWNTNPLERLNKEIKRPHRRRRRLPNPAALLRLAGSVSSRPTTNGRSPTNATCRKSTLALLSLTDQPEQNIFQQAALTA